MASTLPASTSLEQPEREVAGSDILVRFTTYSAERLTPIAGRVVFEEPRRQQLRTKVCIGS
jgi:hypothetical protein